MTAKPTNGKPARVRAHAVALVRAGASIRDAARQTAKKFKTGCTGTTVRRWVRDASEVEDAPPSSAPPPAPPPVEAEADEFADGDNLAELRHMVREQRAVAKQARADGNTTAAQRALKAVGDALNTIARIEARTKADGDTVAIPRAELEAAKARIRDRVTALASDLERTGGIVCSHCGRALRLSLAKGE